jgi:hypothetical protein
MAMLIRRRRMLDRAGYATWAALCPSDEGFILYDIRICRFRSVSGHCPGQPAETRTTRPEVGPGMWAMLGVGPQPVRSAAGNDGRWVCGEVTGLRDSVSETRLYKNKGLVLNTLRMRWVMRRNEGRIVQYVAVGRHQQW